MILGVIELVLFTSDSKIQPGFIYRVEGQKLEADRVLSYKVDLLGLFSMMDTNHGTITFSNSYQ